MAEIPDKSVDDMQKELNAINTVCNNCKEVFTFEKPAKLLHCLHTFCEGCLEKYSKTDQQKEANNSEANNSDTEVSSTADTKLRCPECFTEYSLENVISNPFVSSCIKSEVQAEDGTPHEGVFPKCTSCDDKQKASSFCLDCKEWLCDPCIVAHKRVKITKDHTVSNQVKPEEVKDGVLVDSKPKHMYCATHRTEPLKLFCLTCEMLTCRDCQLNEHKDHKYQFIEETIEQQKTFLLEGVKELKAKLKDNEEMAGKILEKEKDIKKQQVDVFTEVRHVADLITNELISWCKQLLNFLQSVCHGRVKDLTFKRKEVDSFSKKAKHTIDFVEAAIKTGDDLAVLFTKGFMSKNLNILQNQNISFPSTLFDLQIKYENDAKFLTKHVNKMGFINVNGKSYPQQESAEPPKQNPLANLTKENFSHNIAEFLNQYPPPVREKYKGLSADQKRSFLQHLMQSRARQQHQQQLLAQQQFSQRMVTPMNRTSQFNTDSNAIQDLYGAGQRAKPSANIRSMGTYFPENPFLPQSLNKPMNHTLQQSPQPQMGPNSGGNFQNWRGNVGQLMRVETPPVIPAYKIPPGRIMNIDPLNLRAGNPSSMCVKQEPKDRDFNSSCQYSDPKVFPPPAPTPPSPRLQSPPTSTYTRSPGHTPSPCHSDGGPSISALPDITVMDTDRNELLQGLVHPSGQKINPLHLHPKHDPSDPSEDYCGVCHNGGDLLCCDRCPKVFHLQCHVPAISSNLSSSELWNCTMCIPDEELIIETPIVHEFENSSMGKRKAPNGLVDKEIRVCEKILLLLFCHESSALFHDPVPKSIPNYYKIIQHPMDFNTIKCKLRRGHFAHYNSIEECISDVQLVFQNCFTYNAPTSDVYAVGKSVQRYFESLVKHYLPCYLEYFHQQCAIPIVATEMNSADGPSRQKKQRRSPAPDSTRDANSPLHFH